MGKLTTHVLDTANGRPGRGIAGRLYALGNERRLLAGFMTNDDGRVDEPLLQGEDFVAGAYELVFEVGDYFEGNEAPFLTEVVIRFNLSADEHYHVPLLVSPWSYTTYRGS